MECNMLTKITVSRQKLSSNFVKICGEDRSGGELRLLKKSLNLEDQALISREVQIVWLHLYDSLGKITLGEGIRKEANFLFRCFFLNFEKCSTYPDEPRKGDRKAEYFFA